MVVPISTVNSSHETEHTLNDDRHDDIVVRFKLNHGLFGLGTSAIFHDFRFMTSENSNSIDPSCVSQ